ncbi:MAG: molybdopterin converting factor subunit 1 [Spirochaetes bacterium]|nr:molybdopterin converting factor subunit 1 [Spirochaetota bacterium]
MKIKIKAFASVREACGFDEKELTVSDGITVKEVVLLLEKSHGSLSDLLESLLYAINEDYCHDDATLSSGDTLAIFPPVSGG